MAEYLRSWFGPAAEPQPSATQRAGEQQQQAMRFLQQRRERATALQQQIDRLQLQAQRVYQDQSKPAALRKQEATRLLQEKAKHTQELERLKRSMSPLELQQAGINSTLDTVQTMQLLREGTAVQNDLMAEVGGAREAQRTFVAAERALQQTADLSDQLALGFSAETEASIYGVSGVEADEAIAAELAQFDAETADSLLATVPSVPEQPPIPVAPSSSSLLTQMLNTKM